MCTQPGPGLGIRAECICCQGLHYGSVAACSGGTSHLSVELQSTSLSLLSTTISPADRLTDTFLSG